MDLVLQLNGKPRTASIVFAHKVDFPWIAKAWKEKTGNDSHPHRRDSVDFAHLAQTRCLSHSSLQPYAETIDEFEVHIRDNPHSEVACFVGLKCDWFQDGEIIGFCHFRRTWSNNIVLDYLGAHPFISAPPKAYHSTVKGVGSALLYYIIKVAQTCGSEVIWGEATQNSWEFYQNAFKLDLVKDLIFIPKDKFVGFAAKLEANWAKGNTGSTMPVLEEIYNIEAQNPPFVGTRVPVMVPPRKFVQHFLDLPLHIKVEVARSLGLWEEGDVNCPDMELFRRLFVRAIERGKADGLYHEVETKSRDGQPDQNPFSV